MAMHKLKVNLIRKVKGTRKVKRREKLEMIEELTIGVNLLPESRPEKILKARDGALPREAGVKSRESLLGNHGRRTNQLRRKVDLIRHLKTGRHQGRELRIARLP